MTWPQWDDDYDPCHFDDRPDDDDRPNGPPLVLVALMDPEVADYLDGAAVFDTDIDRDEARADELDRLAMANDYRETM